MCFPMIKVWNEEMTDFKCGKVFRWILISTHFCFKCTTKSGIEANQSVLLPSYFYLFLSLRFSSFFHLLFKVVYLLFYFRIFLFASWLFLASFPPCSFNSYPFSFIKRFISCILFFLASLFLGNYSLISLLRFFMLCFLVQFNIFLDYSLIAYFFLSTDICRVFTFWYLSEISIERFMNDRIESEIQSSLAFITPRKRAINSE